MDPSVIAERARPQLVRAVRSMIRTVDPRGMKKAELVSVLEDAYSAIESLDERVDWLRTFEEITTLDHVDPMTGDLAKMSRVELDSTAKKLRIPRFYKLRKDALIDAIRAKRSERAQYRQLVDGVAAIHVGNTPETPPSTPVNEEDTAEHAPAQINHNLE